jgi:hypothetical protein
MLGEKILPSYTLPCTAIISEVKWGESKRALLHFSGIEEQTDRSPTQEIPIDDLANYIVISDDIKDSRESEYEKVEIFWPLELCQNGVEIIDSPGLNEHEARQKITTEYLSFADAILFVLSCNTLASRSELDLIDHILRPAGHDDIFFVCNMFDAIQAKEKEAVRKYGISRLAPRTRRGQERVFFVSALDGLEGRIENDPDRVDRSGITNLERELETFLARDRGNIKILRISRDMQIAIYDVRRTLLDREAMLKIDLDTLESRLEDSQKSLLYMEEERNKIVDHIVIFRSELREPVSYQARQFYLRIADLVPQWISRIEPETSVNLISFLNTKKQAEELVQELLDRLSILAEAEFLSWQEKNLQPLIIDRLSKLMEDLDERGNTFLGKIDAIKFEISGNNVVVENVGPRRVTAVERILAATSGFFVGGLGSAGIGAVLGYQEMAKSILPQFGLAVLTITLVGFNPLLLIPVMVSGGFFQGLWTAKATNKRIKEDIGERYASSVRSTARQRGKEIADVIDNELKDIQDAVEQGLGREIQNIRHQVNSVIREKVKDSEEVENKLSEIDSLRRNINLIDERLGELMAEISIPDEIE